MVVFTCNHCGESLKKNVVDKHVFRCRRDISVSCMDCFKDFDKDYSGHIQCVTELERYSAKGFVPKPNQNKGQRKQEAYVDLVRSITDKKQNLSNGVKKILETISSYDNIPRKKAKFLNFMKNSFRFMKVNDLEEAWSLLEQAMKESKASGPSRNENIDTLKLVQKNGKRLLEEDTSQPSNIKKQKMENLLEREINASDGSPTGESSGKFKWSEVICNILTAKNKELKMKRLKKKVLKKYQDITGTEWNDKIENKFYKKLNKLKGVIVDNEKVRLMD